MTLFRIVAFVECDTPAQADIVATERLSYDEQYDDPETGEPFDYVIDSFVVEPTDAAVCLVCAEPIVQGPRAVDWTHAHGDQTCGTGDGSVAIPWTPTHVSTFDGSAIRVLDRDRDLDLVYAENENGDQLVVDPSEWREL